MSGRYRIGWALAAVLLIALPVRAGDEDLDALFAEPASEEEAAPEQQPSDSAAEPYAETIAVGEEEPPAVVRRPPAARVIEEIVVTATKRAESARAIPVSVDAFAGDQLKDQGAEGSQDVLLRSPGVTPNQYYSSAFTNIQIRGTTINTISTIGGAPTGAFLDEIPLSNPTLFGGNPDIDVFDLASVEVLKGPQGTLFGGSALSGALRSIPNVPDPAGFASQAFVSRLSASDSDRTGQSYGAMLNVPLSSRWALRGMFTHREYPGTIDDTRNDLSDLDRDERRQWRVMLRGAVSERLTLQALAHEVRIAENDLRYTDNPSRHERANENGLSPSGHDMQFAQLKLIYELERFTLQASSAAIDKTGFLRLASDRFFGGQLDGSDIVVGNDPAADAMAHELRAVSAEPSRSRWSLLHGWDWLIGAFYFDSDQALPSDVIHQSLLGNTETAHVDGLSTAKESALFVNVARPFGSAWELTLGARFFRLEYFGSIQQTVRGLPAGGEQRHSDATGINPKFALNWRPRDTLYLFAAATRGYRFGGVNVTLDQDPDAPPFYESDSLWNHELGMRLDLAGGAVQLDATAFYIDWKDVQIAQRTDTGLSTYIDNVGAAVSQGVELGVKALLPFDVLASLGAAYVDARTAADFESNAGPVPEGARLPGTPHLTGSAGLNWQGGWAGFDLRAGAIYTYQGDSFNDLLRQNRIPAYGLVNLSLGLGRSTWPGAPELSLHVANLTDEHTYSGVLPPLSGVSDYFPIRPRTVSVQLGFAF